jgi:hypothetical protein
MSPALTVDRRMNNVAYILAISAWTLLLLVCAVRYASNALQSELINRYVSPVPCHSPVTDPRRILPYPEVSDVGNHGWRAVHAMANGLVLFAVVYGFIGALLLLFRFIRNKVRAVSDTP